MQMRNSATVHRNAVERACLEVAHGTDSVENRVKTALWLMVSSNIPAVMREMFTLGGVMHEGELALGTNY